jgi:hypothetical protein
MTSQYEIRVKKAKRAKPEPVAKCSVVASQGPGNFIKLMMDNYCQIAQFISI